MSQARPKSQSKSSRFPWILSIALSILVVALVGFGVSAIARTGGPTIYTSRVVNEFPHDPKAYCQGLAFGDGVLYEGTGQYGESVLREVDLKTGQARDCGTCRFTE